MKLIPKDAILAEIEKLYQQHSSKEYIDEAGCVLDKLEDIINSLEVKEVDLEKEYKDFVEEDPVYNKLVNGIVGKAIAKHFFELGLRASLTEEKYIGNVKGSYTTTRNLKHRKEKRYE